MGMKDTLIGVAENRMFQIASSVTFVGVALKFLLSNAERDVYLEQEFYITFFIFGTSVFLLWLTLKYLVTPWETRFKTELWNPLTLGHDLLTSVFYGFSGVIACTTLLRIYFHATTKFEDDEIEMSSADEAAMFRIIIIFSGLYISNMILTVVVYPYLGDPQVIGLALFTSAAVYFSVAYNRLCFFVLAFLATETCQLFQNPQRILVRLGFTPTSYPLLFFNITTVASHIIFRLGLNGSFLIIMFMKIGVVFKEVNIFLGCMALLLWVYVLVLYVVWCYQYFTSMKTYYYLDLFGGNVGFRRIPSYNASDPMPNLPDAKYDSDEDVFESQKENVRTKKGSKGVYGRKYN